LAALRIEPQLKLVMVIRLFTSRDICLYYVSVNDLYT